MTKTNVMITSEAIVIPDTGAFEQPIVPANLAETITNSKAKKMKRRRN